MPLRHEDTKIHQVLSLQWFTLGATWSLGDLVVKKLTFFSGLNLCMFESYFITTPARN